jgi:formate hydrogenlyase subunit 6/NADH:ubiquinone oxidoreductase subunit I/flavodoxin
MRGIVVYYSATGSTAKIAKAIHRGMRETIECDIAPLKKTDPQTMGQYDLIALGAPIWYFREPANVRLFIYAMPELDGKLCVPFCTHGASPTGFFWSMVPMLKKRGLTIIGYNSWYGSVYQVLHAPKPYLTDGHPDEIALQEAEDFGREMAERGRRIAAGDTNLIPELPKGPRADSLWQSHEVFRPFPPAPSKPGEPMRPAPPMRESPVVRTVDVERCTYPTCTLCADVCPVNAIDLSRQPILFRKSCLNCALCDKMCPQLAIEVDAETMQRRTQRRINIAECTFPTCTLCVDHCPMDSIDFSVRPPVIKRNCEGDDLCWVICPQGAIEITNLESTHARLVMTKDNHPFVKLLSEAEAQGRFRRHVPLDEVGWDNPVYKNPDHPRFVIEEE